MFPILSTFWSFLRPVFWLFVPNHECNKFPSFFFAYRSLIWLILFVMKESYRHELWVLQSSLGTVRLRPVPSWLAFATCRIFLSHYLIPTLHGRMRCEALGAGTLTRTWHTKTLNLREW